MEKQPAGHALGNAKHSTLIPLNSRVHLLGKPTLDCSDTHAKACTLAHRACMHGRKLCARFYITLASHQGQTLLSDVKNPYFVAGHAPWHVARVAVVV